MKKLVIALSILLMLAVLSSGFWYVQYRMSLGDTSNTGSSTVVSKYDDDNTTPQELLTLVNEERAKAGVAPLKIDERLNTSAQTKADDMFNNNYFDHVSPMTGKHGYELAREKAPECSYVSENFVYGEDGTLSSNQALDWWNKSKAHHDAMTDARYELTGFGISGKKVFVEHFCDIN